MPRKLSQGIAGTGSGGLGSLLILQTTISTSTANESLTLSPDGTGSFIVPSPLRFTNSTTSSTKDTGAVTTEGGAGIGGNLTVGGYIRSTGGFTGTTFGSSTPSTGGFTNVVLSGAATITEFSNVVANKTGATGVVIHDFTESNNWLHSSMSANFTVNLTNTPTTDNRMYVINLYLTQSSIGRLATAFQINGIAQTINWSGNIPATPGVNSFDLQTFTLIRSGAAWRVICSYTTNANAYPGQNSANPAPSGYWMAQNLRVPLSLGSGSYWIKSPAMPNALQMYVDMVQENGGYDFFPINSTTVPPSGGLSVNFIGQLHSGMTRGLDIVYPRSPQHWTAMRNYVSNVLGDTGNTYFQTAYGVYRISGTTGGSRAGNYTGVIMRDPRFYGTGAEDWRVGDGGRWWLRNTTFSEPNSDYTARAFLGLAAAGYTMVGYSGGDIGFNDGSALYALGSSYLVSTNAKP